MLNILLLEDEEGIRSFVKVNLLREGYNVYEAEYGEKALEILRNYEIDIAVLDVLLPDLSGFKVLENIRENDNNIGVIMLTAKSMLEDRIEGLSLGADDYITKPFSPKELVLRIQTLGRRVKGSSKERTTLNTKNFTLSLKDRALYKNNISIDITQTEFEIMKYFIENKGNALSKDEMLDKIWGINYFGSVNTLDVNISRLRRKIEDDPSKPKHIKTVWGYGYKWEDG
ncbi:response regulator transcription factor [Wukongibacter baidiensis]|uniref:response regulator transcription factor n=1 Tax=Wukongibacter baidiensis TaxID=1723361 RepID=UPI003D7F2C43